MTGRLNGKVAIVTGGNSGIGEATVLAFGREGAKVAILARREAEGEAVAKAVRDAGGEAAFFACDVTDRVAVESAVGAAIAKYGAPNVLVNNAGGGVFLNGEYPTDRNMNLKAHDASWDATIALNLTSTYYLTQVCWKPMAEAGGGSIINISSLAAVSGSSLARLMDKAVPNAPPAYFAAKGGVESYTRWCASVGSKFNIRANCIRPGLIETAMQPRNADGSLWLNIHEQFQLTPGWGTPDDVANSVLFLASDESRFMNGQMLNVDGGMATKLS